MTIIRRLLVTAAALPLALIAPTSAGAATPSATTFHGVFTGRDFVNCGADEPSAGVVSGTWNIIKRGDTDATVSINIFVNGKHHVSFGGPIQQTPVTGAIVAVGPLYTQAGWLTISLTDDDLSYTIAPYGFSDLNCASVTYNGSLGR